VVTGTANTLKIGNSSIMNAQLGDLVITWTAISVKFNYGDNSATLTLSPP
jgi:hypothetical protein